MIGTLKTIHEELQEHLRTAVGRAYKGVVCEMPNIGVPPAPSMGDFAIPCFFLKKFSIKKPDEIAQELVGHFRYDALQEFEAIQAVGPYINITLKSHRLFGFATDMDLRKKPLGIERMMVEFLSPNTNKPLHLGHIRNGVIGMTVSNLLEHCGNTVIKANLINDRGIHICKSMLAWLKFGGGETPESAEMKGDHLVGKYYVLFDTLYKQEVAGLVEGGMSEKEAKKNAPLILEAQEMLQDWENGDPEVVSVWKQMNSWVYKGFDETCTTLGFTFDEVLYESNTYKFGKDIVLQGFKDGVFEKDEDGNIVFILPSDSFGKTKEGGIKIVTLLRSNGTSLYSTQDIGTAVEKVVSYGLTKSIYVVGSEQNYHFKCLFEMLSALEYEWSGNCSHLSYGMVNLPDGKMKSREGTTVDADDLVQEVSELAAIATREKHDSSLAKEEVARRAQIIALGAIKFFLLQAKPKNEILFDPKQSLSFEGKTGPYCQYAYARASGILRKAKELGLSSSGCDLSYVGSETEERVLAQKLLAFPDQVEAAAADYNPAILADAVYEVARSFSQFYNKHQVTGVGFEKEKARLALVESVEHTLRVGFKLLGMETLDEM